MECLIDLKRSILEEARSKRDRDLKDVDARAFVPDGRTPDLRALQKRRLQVWDQFWADTSRISDMRVCRCDKCTADRVLNEIEG